MKIGIMGAMVEEVDIIRQQMSDISEVTHGNRVYFSGYINGIEVVLVFSRWGKVAAATTTTSLITIFNVNKIIFTGVAGAASAALNTGDVVISTRLYQHDMDPSPMLPKHEVPLTGITFFEADTQLIKDAQQAADIFLASISTIIPQKELKTFNIVSPKCSLGMIASGDLFVSSVKQTQSILHDHPETQAVEMEGAAVAQVCFDYGIPFVVIRTISDRADHDAAINFPRFIQNIAQHYSDKIICKMFSIGSLSNTKRVN